MEPTIKEAMEHEPMFLHNPQLYREYEAREKAVKDRISQIITAREEVKDEVIINSLKMGLDYAVISKIASVSVEKVKEIASRSGAQTSL